MEASEDGGVVHLEHWDLQDDNDSNNDNDNDDNDDSFVPDSLKGFLEEANRKMEHDLAQILSPDDMQLPVVVPDEQDEQDEQDEDVVHMGSDNDNTMDESFLSPPDIVPTVNPAAHLTFGAAKGMAMDDDPDDGHDTDDDMDGDMGDPVVVNLQQQLEQAVDPISSSTPSKVISTPSKATPPSSSLAPSPHRGPVQTLRDQVRGKMPVPPPTPPSGTHSLPPPDPPGHPRPRRSLDPVPDPVVPSSPPSPPPQPVQPALSNVSMTAVAKGVLSTPSKKTSPTSFPQTVILANSPPPSSSSKLASQNKVTSPTPTTATNANAKTPVSRSKTKATSISSSKNNNNNNNNNVGSSNKENPASMDKRSATPTETKKEPSSDRKPLSHATSPVTRPSIGSYQTPPPSIPQSKRRPTTPLSASKRNEPLSSSPQSSSFLSTPLRPEARPKDSSIRSSSPRPSGVAMSPAGLSLNVTPIHPSTSLASPVSSSLLSSSKRNPRLSARKVGRSAMVSPNKSAISHVSKTTTNHATGTPDHWKGRKPLTSPGMLSPRILQETVASKAHFAQEQEQQQQQAKAQELQSPPGMVSPRLLQDTAASKARVAQETTQSSSPMLSPATKASLQPVSSRLLQPTETLALHHPEQHPEVEDTLREQEKKEAERQQAMDARDTMRKRKMREKKQKMQTMMARARSRKERLEEMEKERIAKLKAKVEEKEEKARLRKLEIENNRPKSTTRPTNNLVSPPPRSRAPSKPTPTIPITPKFQTDKRLKAKHLSNPPKDPVPLAQSDNILKQCLRSEGKPPTPDVRSHQGTTPRTLTIPRGPRLSTSKRHRATTPTPGENSIEARSSWETELRHPSSPIASDRSTSSRLTIPQTPHFQEIRHRAKPKSTAEKEKEMMDYYKSHPFKARPVMMNDPGPPSTRPPPPSRPLTTPSPFHFHTDQRLGRASTSKANETPTEDITRVRLFSDRPRTSKEETPKTRPSPAPRGLTVPQPFQFHSSERRKERTSPQEDRPSSTFRARPMPDFSRHTGLTMVQKTESRHSRDPPVEHKGSRLRQRPLSTSISRRRQSTARQQPSEDAPKFRARPMPNFDNVDIPVVAQKPSSPPQKSSRGAPDPSEGGLFHARGVPDFSKPTIPVKHRDPSKLRSPEDFQRMHSKHPKEESVSQFKALPAPPTTVGDPDLPVRKKNPIKVDREKLRRRSLAVRTKPDSSAGASSFVVRSAPLKSPPSIPVRSKDPSKLRGPKEASRLGGPRRIQGPQESGKEAMKARVRERMMGRKSGVHATAPNDSGERYPNQPTSAALKMALANSSSPKPSLSETDLLTAPVSSPQLAPTPVFLEGEPAGVSDGCAVELFPPESNAQMVSTPDPKQDAGAQHGGNSTPEPKRSPDPPGTAVDDRDLYGETMQLAAQLQRAAEEELSFHGGSGLSWKL